MATAKDEAQVGEEAESNVLKDRWGNERPWDGSKYPDDSAAHEGHITKPSGQGGASPKSRPDYQDMFPKNPEPSEHAKDWGERLRRQEQGEEDVDFTTPYQSSGDKKASKRSSSDDESGSDREARTARVAAKDSPK